MVAAAIRPFSMTTCAWMSPWRDVPHPKYVPSLYCGFTTSGTTGAGVAAACSSSAAGSSAVAAGALTAIGAGVSARRFTDRRGAFVTVFAGGTARVFTDGGGKRLVGGATVAGAGITG